MSDEKQLVFLISKRENLFEKLQIMYDVGKQALKDKSKLSSFKIRYSYLNEIYEKFEDYHDRISQLQLSIKPDDPVDNSKLKAFEGLFFAVKVMAEDLLPPDTESVVPLTENTSFREKGAQPRLPKIDLPTWDSSLKTWITFHDKFKALVHDNASVDPVEKFHYLLQAVSGPALSLIKSLPLTAGNYPIVWELLVKKYQNKRVLGADILDRLISCPSFSSETVFNLNSFIEIFCDGVTALRAVNIPNLADFILLQIGLQKLPFLTRKQFENHHLDQEIPCFDQLALFLDNQTQVLEISKSSDNCRSLQSKPLNKGFTTGVRSRPKMSNSYNPPVVRTSFVLSKVCKCPVCHADHSIYKCPTFLKMSPCQRRSKVRSLRHCFNCLKKDHMRDKCVSKIRCFSCKSPHHSLLHEELETVNPITVPKQSTSSTDVSSEPFDSRSHPQGARCHISSNGSVSQKLMPSSTTVLLGTAMISIKSFSGHFVPVRALIDSGSQVSFITASCAQRLGLGLSQCDLSVAGLAKRLVTETKGLTSCIIRPCNCSTPQFTTEAVVLKEITSRLPSGKLPSELFGMFRSLDLADPKFDAPGSVDFLIAADLFPFIFDGQKITDSTSGLTALHSVYGWVLTGKINHSVPTSISSFLTTWESSDDVLKKFWEVEEPPTPSVTNPEDIDCENIFKQSHYRNPDGRYVVPLPFKTEPRPKFYTQPLALKRLLSLERRLNQVPDIRHQYQDFLDEYERLGHMTKVPYQPSIDKYYIPHHAVINSNSTTTKLRVVFDGSAHFNHEPSLNQLLHIGPKLQSDLVAILIRFRLHKFVFTADICQMYRQILLRPEDRRYQHIIWRRSSECDIEEFELNTITYGLTPSPYLALRTLRQLALDEGENFPLAVDILLNDIYIDDVISGSSSKEETSERIIDLKALLVKGGFELRKWSSNCPDLLSAIPLHLRQSTLTFDADGREIFKILGIQWNATMDCFTYQVSSVDSSCSKRKLLSHIASIYDPIGWLAPITFRLKCLLQHLWRLGLQWDEELPSFILDEWSAHRDQLHALSQVSIPRCVLAVQHKTLRLVGFCDASEKGYCGVVYLCTENEKAINCNLLLAKSKVAPLKVLSIPRLELCGAVLLSKLLKYCSDLLASSISCPLEVFAFSDSSTVLSWLHTPTYRLKTFVAARVHKIITSLPPSIWYHVGSKFNPADCASRGLQPQQFVEYSLWWTGPPFLAQPVSDWPVQRIVTTEPDLPELKDTSSLNTFHQTTVTTLQRDTWIPLSKFSSLTKLTRVTAWCLRYLSNLRPSSKKKSYGPLTTNELNIATCRIVREVQWQFFANDIIAIGNNTPYSSQLRKLTPFLDPLGCLRVGGRLTFSNLHENSVHPFILPKKSDFTTLVIDYYHLTYLHAGPRVLQSLICQKYWILSVRNAIRSRLAKCNICFKCKPVPLEPKMADLPSPRVTLCRPFLNVGIDFGGPFFIKESMRRNAKCSKCYLSLFVCLATKAVHLEVVSDLSTSAFLAAFDRFVSRRGLCVNVYTDCGTNFVGAHRYLNDLFSVLHSSNTYISDYLSQKSINWYFNVPTASHWGGLWEAGIRSTKYHLRRILKDQVLTFEEMSTLFSKIEAVLNSRPICSLSPDPGEINVLTPGHFLTGGPLVAVPEYDVRQENLSRLDRWQLIHRATLHFWDRWSREYLHTLQQRSKWFSSSGGLKEGDIVVILTEKSPSTMWRTGRVESLVTGKDGVVRAASILTAQGRSLLRPLVKICPLPSQ